MAIRTDFSRLCLELPIRESLRDERRARRSAVILFDDVKKDGFAWPKTANVDRDAKYCISQALDASMLRVYNESVKLIQGTDEHVASYSTLAGAPKNCKRFNKQKAILEKATPFEQMVALDQWIDDKEPSWTKGRRTICFRIEDDIVPIYIAKTSKTHATTMTTMLGTGSRGKMKAPRYEDLASDQALVHSSIFIKPLECLELVRQPHFSAATIIKGNAWGRDVIDHTRRYEITDVHDICKTSQFACVELVGQKKKNNSPTKEASAAANLISLVKKHPNRPINRVLHYEDLAAEGYKDDAELSITPKAVWLACEKSVKSGNASDLDEIMRQLFVTELGGFTSPVVKQYYAGRVF